MDFHQLPPQFGRSSQEIITKWWEKCGVYKGDDAMMSYTRLHMLFNALCHAEAGHPYYKVWPDYLDMFRRTRLDNVPATALQFPFPAWRVLLPVDYRLPILGKTATALAVSDSDAPRRARWLAQAYGENPPIADGDPKAGRHLTLIIGRIDGDGNRTESLLTLSIDTHLAARPGSSVEELINSAFAKDAADSAYCRPMQRPDDPSVETWNESAIEAFRIMLSVAFIATGEYRFVNRDVLSADMSKYREALRSGDEPTLARIADKADRRRGQLGFTIGKFHAIDVLSQRLEHVEGESEEQRELRYQHLRSGHFHAYWCGPGRKERRVKFLAPVVVRPDLPPAGQVPARLIR